MAISHVQVVSVYVSDQNKALDFYVGKLGFEKVRDEPLGWGDLRWVQVKPPRGQTTIVLASGYGRDDWAEQVGKSGNIVFEADDIQGTYEDLAAKGVEFTEPPTAQPWGMMQAIFKDQDGNEFVLVSSLPTQQ